MKTNEKTKTKTTTKAANLPAPAGTPAELSPAPAATAATIRARRIALLARPEGATREELIRVSPAGYAARLAGKDADSGLPGLRKSGLRIGKKRDASGRESFFLDGGDYVTKRGIGNVPLLP